MNQVIMGCGVTTLILIYNSSPLFPIPITLGLVLSLL